MKHCVEEGEHKIYKEAYEMLRLHFVYNSMNAIKYYIGREPETASLMVSDLAVFLRGSVENALAEKMIPLSEELKFAHAYAELEKFRSRKWSLLWQVNVSEGYVPSGCIYRCVEKFIKTYILSAEEARTLCVTDMAGEAIRIQIRETKETELIPICKMIDE